MRIRSGPALQVDGRDLANRSSFPCSREEALVALTAVNPLARHLSRNGPFSRRDRVVRHEKLGDFLGHMKMSRCWPR